MGTAALAAEVPQITQLREMSLDTALVADGKAACLIVIPDGSEYGPLGAKLANAIKSACGAAPPVVQAGKATEEAVQSTNVIAVGVFANNPTVEQLYDRMLVSCDWSWPQGENAYVIRTVHNPWLTGKNVVYIGSVTPGGCEAGIDRFIEMLGESKTGAVGPIIAVSPAPAPLTEDNVASYLSRINGETSSRSMDGLAASYAHSYFTTGDPQWGKIFLAGMRKLIQLHEEEGDASDVRSCRQIFKQFERIDAGPAFTPEERLELTNLFLRFASLMPYASSTEKPSVQPHGNNWNATGASYAGMYFSRYYPDLEIGKKLLENMDIYYEPNMVNWKVNEDCPGYGNITLTGNYDWALARPDSRYFELDCLRKMADYDMLITDNAGRVSGFGDASGLGGPYVVNGYLLAAWKYKDGRYLWWWDRYVGRSGAYWVPEEVLPRQRPDDLLGVNKAPLAEWIYNRSGAREFPIGDCYDKVSFRNGFEQQDQYMCVSGFCYGFHSHADANCIVRYFDKGQVRLYDDGYMIPALSEHNTVTILKDGWAGRTPELAQVTAEADFDDVGIFESRLDKYNGVCWDRTIVWPKGRFFLVVDDMQCIDPAQYSFQCIWRTLGSAKLEGKRWTSVKDPGRFNLVIASDAALCEKESAGTSLNSPPFPLTEARALVEATKADMEVGDSYQFANLVYTTGLEGDDKHADCYRVGDTTTYMISDDGQPIAAGVNRSTVIPGTAIEARAFYLTSTSLTAAAATTIRVRGPLVRSNLPVNVDINLGTGDCKLECAETVEVTHATADGETTVTLEAGSHELKLPAFGRLEMRQLDEQLKAALAECASAAVAGKDIRQPGSGEKLAKLWEYKDFRVYANFAALLGVKCRADRTPMTPAEAGYGVGKPEDLLHDGGNVMFHDGETVVLDIELPEPARVSQAIVNSRQLKTFNSGCGISKLTVWVSDDNFAKDKRLLGEFTNSKELEDNVMPYSVMSQAPATCRYVRIEAVPYTKEHNVYIDSVQINGTADKSKLMASGFHLNAMAVADINGDGRDEAFTAGTDKAIHAIAADGSGLWQYPVPNVINDLTAVNSTGKGDYQIVAACDDTYMYSVKADGTENFKVQPPPRTYARPGYRGVKPFVSRLTVAYNADIQNDGNAEIIIGSANWRTYVYDHQGELIWDEVCWAHTPTCGDAFDLDGDGRKEVIMGNSYTSAVVYSPDGKVIGSGGGSGHAGPTALGCADLDGNGKGEIVVGDRAGIIWFQEWKGRNMPTYNTGMDIASVAIGDLDGDGKLETLVASKNYILYTFDADGKPLRQTNLLAVARDIAIADVMGDAAPEILCACEDGTVKILNAEGEVIGWYQGGGWMRHVAACELDGNKSTREVVVTCDDGSVYGLQVTQ